MEKTCKTVEQKIFFEKHLIPDVNILLSDHCNLNCASCTNYAPLANKKFTPFEVIEKDIKKLSELAQNKVARIDLMGGEPLLNPEIVEIMWVSRKYFPSTNIAIETNGILLKSMPEEFWQTVKETGIIVRISLYNGINSVDEIKNFAKEKGADFRQNCTVDDWCCQNEHKIVIETNGGCLDWKYYPLDLSGKQDLNYNFENCEQHCCCCLHEGFFYPCTRIANIKHFNKYFNEELSICEKDRINIHENCTAECIFEFLKNPVPFCKYCNVKSEKFIAWKKSTCDKIEWT